MWSFPSRHSCRLGKNDYTRLQNYKNKLASMKNEVISNAKVQI